MQRIGKRSLILLGAGMCLVVLLSGCINGNTVTRENHQLLQMYTLPSLGEQVFSLITRSRRKYLGFGS